ncbi:putative SOS response-associated peptidase YedK [compost metagenome]
MIITADAQGGMVDVHDRRPVVLSPELAYEWIAAGMPSEQAEQLALNLGEPAEAFEWYRVGAAAGNVRNQGTELIEPISEPGWQGDLKL